MIDVFILFIFHEDKCTAHSRKRSVCRIVNFAQKNVKIWAWLTETKKTRVNKIKYNLDFSIKVYLPNFSNASWESMKDYSEINFLKASLYDAHYKKGIWGEYLESDLIALFINNSKPYCLKINIMNIHLLRQENYSL